MPQNDFFQPLFGDIFKELDRAFETAGRQFTERARNRPTINVTTSDDAVAVTASLPGLDPESLQVQLAGDTLSISGTIPEQKEHGDVISQERSAGPFKRSVSLPYAVDASSATAQYKNGLLVITLAAAQASPVNIPVTF